MTTEFLNKRQAVRITDQGGIYLPPKQIKAGQLFILLGDHPLLFRAVTPLVGSREVYLWQRSFKQFEAECPDRATQRVKWLLLPKKQQYLLLTQTVIDMFKNGKPTPGTQLQVAELPPLLESEAKKRLRTE